MPLVSAVLLVTVTALSYPIAIEVGTPPLLPALNTIGAFFIMVSRLKRQRVTEGVVLMIIWAVTMGACATWIAYRDPHGAAAMMLNGAAYRDEMFGWLATGVGRESDPSRFVPQHLLHVGVFAILAAVSGGALAMPMGAVLMNYMSVYVGSLANVSPTPALTAMLAWHPWAVIRILSFVVIGVVLAGPVLSRILKFPFRLRDHQRLLVAAGIGLVLDIAFKWTLAPTWRALLAQTVGWAPSP